MIMYRRSRRILFTLAVLIFSLLVSVISYANSAPIQVTIGDPGCGVIPRGESPIEVEQEVLTFDIPVLEAEDTDYDIDEAKDRSGTVTAQYTFRNPAKDPVTVRMAFAQGAERRNTSCDVRKNDRPLSTQIRYTYTDYFQEFYGPSDVEKIRDTYVEDPFFDPEMPVRELIFDFQGLPDDVSADALFTYSIPDKTNARIMIPCAYRSDGEYEIEVENQDHIAVYLFGDSDGVETVWNCCLPSGEKMSFAPEMGRQMTLLEFAKMSMAKIPDISDVDCYNAVVDGMNADRHFDLILSYLPGEDFYTTMWIEYEFPLGPEETAVNSVKAVLAPEWHNYRRKPEYAYHYLLSPAQCWKKFGSLDVYVNTPHKLCEPYKEEFEVTENGYQKHYDSLPDGELSFRLTPAEGTGAESGGTETAGHDGAIFGLLLFAGLAAAAIVAVIVAVMIIVIIVICVGQKKKRNKPEIT